MSFAARFSPWLALTAILTLAWFVEARAQTPVALPLPVPAEITAYIERLCLLPGVKAWIDDALLENDFRDFEEPYRIAPAKAA